ncbi:MAG: FAD-dependent oxidoreductase [Marinilabiliaceae bacterium]|jgi:heterodisulfide reductase subunit A|nr:FAD-dependent oxidoreductase [Marinilabiliaceae bacterium]
MGKHIVIIGGGTAGCVAAGRLAREGYNISLLEKDVSAGGKVRNWFQLFPDRRKSNEVLAFLEKEIKHPLIDFRVGEKINKISRDKGKFNISTESTTIKGADALLIATGFDLFEAGRKEEYGYGIYPDVITSPELEDMFHKGKIRTSLGQIPERIGIVHCVGSRDEKVGNFHCSKVCCVTAVKQAIEIKENLPDTEVICFYMDMRMFGPYYEELYRESQEKWGVQFIRGKVSETSENIDGRLVIKAEDTLSGRPIKMNVDLLVLMLGMENAKSGLALREHLDLGVGVNSFFSIRDNHYGNNLSDIEGLFYAGTCTAPMNITDTISHARAAVTEITEYLNKNQ